jgi:hypothetical protein
VTDHGGPELPYDYTRVGQTLIELHTGGKALSRRRNFFTISPYLEEVLSKLTGLRDYTVSRRTIYPADTVVTVMGLQVPANGLLHISLPDNEVFDVTPTAAGVEFYRFDDVFVQKHLLGLAWPSGLSSDPPADPNRRVFTEDRPGLMALQLVAIVSNSAPAWPLTNLVRFEVDEIPGSTKTWGPNNPGGRPEAWGSALFATVFFTNLPPNNSSFGTKFVRLKLAGEIRDTKCFWVFYPADAYNYPGCPPSTYSDPDKQDPWFDRYRPPNYFFYYMQTTAKYGSPLFDYRGSHETRPAEHPTLQPPYPYYVEARAYRSRGYTPMYGKNLGKTYRFINVFAYACRHEDTHGSDFDA